MCQYGFNEFCSCLFILTKNRAVVRISHVHGRTDIALQSSGVVSKSTIDSRQGSFNTTDRSQVDGHVGEGPRLDEATSNTCRQRDIPTTNAWGRYNNGAVVRDVLAIPAETVLVSIKDWRILRRGGPLGPVPVLCVTSSEYHFLIRIWCKHLQAGNPCNHTLREGPFRIGIRTTGATVERYRCSGFRASAECGSRQSRRTLQKDLH
jgi:hypothetical protein